MWSYCVCTSAIKVPRNDRVMHREAVCQPSYLVHLSHLPSLHSRHRQALGASSCSSFVPYWKSPKLYRQLWTSQVLISVPSLLCWNANSTGKSAQRAPTNMISMHPRTLVKCRAILRFRMISYILKIDSLIFYTLTCQINKFWHQQTQNMTTDIIYEDLYKLFRTGEPFRVSEQCV